uniref:Ca_chan_IQ domain-containing protein n=1 Tax=Ascaris lumbricoides TaxID=6252 RepID=A0A0M3I8E2_ASCLU
MFQAFQVIDRLIKLSMHSRSEAAPFESCRLQAATYLGHSRQSADQADLKQRLLKAAVSKQPHILATVDNQQIKDLIQQMVSGDDPSMLNFDQIQAINEWLEQLDDNHNDRKSDEPHNIIRRAFVVKRIAAIRREHRKDNTVCTKDKATSTNRPTS